MLTVSAVMYAVSAVHWAMNMAVAATSMEMDRISMTSFEILVVIYLPTINVCHPLRLHLGRGVLIAAQYILSDGIVVWRAWVLWGPSRRFIVFTPPLISLVCTLGKHKRIRVRSLY